ncbi:MAG: nucleotidyltransferase domain-containing protein [Ginsengibacter sp.]
MITEKQIQKVTEIIVEEIQPEKVFLFGSYVSGKINRNSDVDMVIVVTEDLNKKKRIEQLIKINHKTALPDLLFPKDFKLYSLNEYCDLKNKKYSFLYSAMKNAKTLYERK